MRSNTNELSHNELDLDEAFKESTIIATQPKDTAPVLGLERLSHAVQNIITQAYIDKDDKTLKKFHGQGLSIVIPNIQLMGTLLKKSILDVNSERLTAFNQMLGVHANKIWQTFDSDELETQLEALKLEIPLSMFATLNIEEQQLTVEGWYCKYNTCKLIKKFYNNFSGDSYTYSERRQMLCSWANGLKSSNRFDFDRMDDHIRTCITKFNDKVDFMKIQVSSMVQNATKVEVSHRGSF